VKKLPNSHPRDSYQILALTKSHFSKMTSAALWANLAGISNLAIDSGKHSTKERASPRSFQAQLNWFALKIGFKR